MANFGFTLTFLQFKIEPHEDYSPDQYLNIFNSTMMNITREQDI